MNAKLTYFETFSDASGAIGTVSVGPFTYAFNYIGTEARRRLIGGPSGFISRPYRARCEQAAMAAFMAKLNASVGPDWFRECAAMYA